VSATDETQAVELDPGRIADWLGEDPAPQLIDVRAPYEREAGHIAGSDHIELQDLPSATGSIERERPVVFYCRVGARSLMAAQAFRASGYEAYSMRGGLARWADEGHPLTPQDGYVADD
jgi:rhodanese-related sulfurtransferase